MRILFFDFENSFSCRCNAPGQNNLVTCTPNERQCYVNVSGANPISMGCIDPNTVINSQFESQQNYLKPIELKTHQQTPTFRRLKFACRLNHCNSIVMEPRVNRSFSKNCVFLYESFRLIHSFWHFFCRLKLRTIQMAGYQQMPMQR